MTDWGLIAARTAQFWAVATMFGGAGLLVLVRRPGPAAVMGVLRAATAVAVLSGIAWLTCVVVGVTGDAGGLLDLETWRAVAAAPFGPPWIARLGFLGLTCGLAWGRRPGLFCLAGLCLALDQAWLGHAATGSGMMGAAQIGAYWLHVLAGFAWVGGLVMLCALAWAERGLPADALRVFSMFGVSGVVLILASGIINAVFRLRAVSDLVETPYGLVISTKLVLLAGMVALAAFNRREGPGPRRGLAVSVGVETVLGLGVLVAAAILGISAPPG